MVRAISNFGAGYRPPSYNALRGELLQKAVANVDRLLDVWRFEGKKTGFVLTSDGWEDVTGKPLINVLLSTPMGAHFVEAKNASAEHVHLLTYASSLASSCILQWQTTSLLIVPELVLVLPGKVKDASYIADLWMHHIDKVGPNNVSAIITDGAAVNPKAAKIVIDQ